MKNRILILIALVLFVSAGMWSLVYSGGVQINQTPSIVDDGTTISLNKSVEGFFAGANRIRIGSPLEMVITSGAPATQAGANLDLDAQDGGACCAEGSAVSGGGVFITGGVGGAGTGAAVSGNGGQANLRGGATGADGGAGQGSGGSITLQGGAGSTSATRGNVSFIAGSGISFRINDTSSWQFNATNNLQPNDDSTYDIGTSSLRPRVIYGDAFSAQNTATALGAAATTFAAPTSFNTVTGDGGGNTIATITGAVIGQTLSLLFVDALVTITDDDTHAADSVDLSAAFTSADDTTLTLLYDGTSWYETSRSVN
jgi:hypothetical protein